MQALFPRFYVEKHWDEDGLMFGVRDSWTKQLLFNSWLPGIEEANDFARLEERRVHIYGVHDCILNSMTMTEYGITYRCCSVCRTYLGEVSNV